MKGIVADVLGVTATIFLAQSIVSLEHEASLLVNLFKVFRASGHLPCTVRSSEVSITAVSGTSCGIGSLLLLLLLLLLLRDALAAL